MSEILPPECYSEICCKTQSNDAGSVNDRNQQQNSVLCDELLTSTVRMKKWHITTRPL